MNVDTLLKVYVVVAAIILVPCWLVFVRYMIRETKRYRRLYKR